jgi:hypothetical protein
MGYTGVRLVIAAGCNRCVNPHVSRKVRSAGCRQRVDVEGVSCPGRDAGQIGRILNCFTKVSRVKKDIEAFAKVS